jgi:LysR family cyn operon transcriptional activator
MSGMNLRHLRAFVSIADAGGFARGANRMNLSQPALSRQIHALETELGVPLFDRIGRRVQLTSEGEDLLRRSRHLLTEADSLGERARLLKAGETGILRVGATPQVIENTLANFLTQYRRRHPAVEVHLVEDGGVRLPSRLERGDVHLAFTPANARFEGTLLYPMHVLAALPPTHRLGRRVTLEITELAEEPLLLLRRDFGSREWFDAPAASLTSSRACCWKAPPRIRSSRWPQVVTASRSFPPMHRCRVALSVRCRWFTAEHRSDGGR